MVHESPQGIVESVITGAIRDRLLSLLDSVVGVDGRCGVMMLEDAYLLVACVLADLAVR